MTKPVLRATFWKSNAELIEDCVRLGYLKPEWKTLDPTYGKGIWWKNWKPKRLVKHDLELDGVDFRNLPHRANTFDAITYDPPYVSAGGRATTTIREFYAAYGLHGAPTTPKKLQRLINDGLTEMHRVVKPGGIVMVKCQDYISSGSLWSGTYLTERKARALGFEVVDKLIHIRKSGGPQPKGRTRKGPNGTRIDTVQQHARGNTSMLLVLRKK